jgi:SET domain-containing protein
MILSCLFFAPTVRTGRGVFTNDPIRAGTILEISPVIVMNAGDRKLLDRTLLHDYIFEWGQNKNQCCVALGYVSLYNHSYRSNCEYEMDYAKDIISIKTIRLVKEGEELTINYSGDWNSKKKVWFEVT